MKFMSAVFIVLSMSGASLAENATSRFKVENGRIIVAQSYCRMCVDSATACIQACDDRLRDCREQNCGSRYR